MPRQTLPENNRLEFVPIISRNAVSGFSSRLDGNMSLCYGDTSGALENRRKFLGDLGADYRNLACAKQVHAANIYCVERVDAGRGAQDYADAIEETDALITKEKGLPLAIFTADCLSVFIFDPFKPAVGLVHAGWRSSKENITAKAVCLMQERFGSRPQNIIASFGPSIRGCCYEVGAEFRDHFAGFIEQRQDKTYLDLTGFNKKELIGAGVNPDNISDCRICTSCSSGQFFSFRRHGSSCGRSMSIMMLR